MERALIPPSRRILRLLRSTFRRKNLGKMAQPGERFFGIHISKEGKAMIFGAHTHDLEEKTVKELSSLTQTPDGFEWNRFFLLCSNWSMSYDD